MGVKWSPERKRKGNGRGLYHDLAFRAQHLVLTPQTAHLGQFLTPQPVVALAGVEFRLTEPVPQRC
jgi:hypothetical protein